MDDDYVDDVEWSLRIDDRSALDRQADVLVGDVLSASDKEILDKVREDGEDPAVVEAKVQALFEHARIVGTYDDYVDDVEWSLGKDRRR